MSGLVVDSDGKLIKKFIAELKPFHLEAFHIVFSLRGYLSSFSQPGASFVTKM